MPLIDITLKPPGTIFFGEVPGPSHDPMARLGAVRQFAKTLPALLTADCPRYGLDHDTPSDGVAIMFHDFTQDDINVPDVWLEFRFSEDRPDLAERHRIRDELYVLVRAGIPGLDVVIDLFWGPTNGKGKVNGTEIAW